MTDLRYLNDPDLTPAEVLEELGASLAHFQENVAQVKAELKSRIRDAHAAGVPKVDIARFAGVSRPTVDKWLAQD